VLTIEAPYYFIKGNTVFRDHQDPDQFYFLPGNPKLAAENGKLDFTLYKYRFDITDNPGSDPTRAKGAGLALFSTEIPAANFQALQDEVASQSGRSNARLTPVIFTTASVHALVAHADEAVGLAIEDGSEVRVRIGDVEQRDVAERLHVEETLRRRLRRHETAWIEPRRHAGECDLEEVASRDQCRIPGTLMGLP